MAHLNYPHQSLAYGSHTEFRIEPQESVEDVRGFRYHDEEGVCNVTVLDFADSDVHLRHASSQSVNIVTAVMQPDPQSAFTTQT
jgi:hypothetical protein